MTEEFSADIDIQDDGTIFICAPDEEAAEGRQEPHPVDRPRRSRSATSSPDASSRSTDFGAFVELKKGTDGLLPCSRLAPRASA